MKDKIYLLIAFVICAMIYGCTIETRTDTYTIESKDSIASHFETVYKPEYCWLCGHYVAFPEMDITHMALHNPKKEEVAVPTKYIFTLKNDNNHISEYMTNKECWQSKEVGDTINVTSTHIR